MNPYDPFVTLPQNPLAYVLGVALFYGFIIVLGVSLLHFVSTALDVWRGQKAQKPILDLVAVVCAMTTLHIMVRFFPW